MHQMADKIWILFIPQAKRSQQKQLERKLGQDMTGHEMIKAFKASFLQKLPRDCCAFSASLAAQLFSSAPGTSLSKVAMTMKKREKSETLGQACFFDYVARSLFAQINIQEVDMFSHTSKVHQTHATEYLHVSPVPTLHQPC